MTTCSIPSLWTSIHLQLSGVQLAYGPRQQQQKILCLVLAIILTSINIMIIAILDSPVCFCILDPPPPLLNVSLGFQNGTSTSVVTLQWAPPTSTGGVNVSYVLTVSPPPVSWSTITTQTSTDITVSYNIQYNVTIRTESCAGSSNGAIVFFELGKQNVPHATIVLYWSIPASYMTA